MSPRRIAAVRAAPAVLSTFLLGGCVAVPELRGRPPAAVLEVRGSAARLASCLADAYAADSFRLEIDTAGRGTRVTAYGTPGRLAPWRRRSRFEIEVADTGPGTAEVVLRTAPTLLGPEAEVARLRRRVDTCADAASEATFRSIAGTPRRGLRALLRTPSGSHFMA